MILSDQDEDEVSSEDRRPPQFSPRGGDKFDESKLRYDLVPVDALAEVARVFTFGANKYGDRNWERGLEWGRLYSAAHRHLNQWWAGESLDSESRIQHLAHATVNCMMALAFVLRGSGEDDREVLERPLEVVLRTPTETRS